MKKVFISQPMSVVDEDEVLKERESVKKALEEYFGEEIEIIENYYKKNIPENAKRIWFLGDSIKLMTDADLIYFTRASDTSLGCRIEKMCAMEYELIYMNDIR